MSEQVTGRRVFVMPFGKHKGKTMDEIPESYLQWLLTIEKGYVSNNVQKYLARKKNLTNVSDRHPLPADVVMAGRENESCPFE